jgi:hypothetical protein
VARAFRYPILNKEFQNIKYCPQTSEKGFHSTFLPSFSVFHFLWGYLHYQANNSWITSLAVILKYYLFNYNFLIFFNLNFRSLLRFSLKSLFRCVLFFLLKSPHWILGISSRLETTGWNWVLFSTLPVSERMSQYQLCTGFLKPQKFIIILYSFSDFSYAEINWIKLHQIVPNSKTSLPALCIWWFSIFFYLRRVF